MKQRHKMEHLENNKRNLKHKFCGVMFVIFDSLGHFFIRLSRKCATASIPKREVEELIEETQHYIDTGVQFEEHKDEIIEGIENIKSEKEQLEEHLETLRGAIYDLYDSFLRSDFNLMSEIFRILGLTDHIENNQPKIEE